MNDQSTYGKKVKSARFKWEEIKFRRGRKRKQKENSDHARLKTQNYNGLKIYYLSIKAKSSKRL